MVWFKVDDGFLMSRKVLSIPKAQRLPAVGLWTLAGAWSAGQLTDGSVPAAVVDDIFGARTLARVLVAAQLWEENEHGFRFHDWSDYQPSRDEVLADRADSAARQRAYRDRKRTEREATRNGATNGATNGVPTRPDPTRPDRSSFGTTRERETRASARTPKPRESTGTKRLREIAAAAKNLDDADARGRPPQLGNTP